MKKRYKTLLFIAIVLEIILLLFFDKKVAAYGPVLFWAVGLVGILNSASNMSTLSKSVKNSKPELYKKYSFGFMITRNALGENEFLNTLNEEEKQLIENNKIIFNYLVYCFLLFAASALILVLK
jgi:hypothetical protein